VLIGLLLSIDLIFITEYPALHFSQQLQFNN